MKTEQTTFDIDYEGDKLKIQRHSLGNQVIYRVVFPDRRVPLILTRALKDTAEKFWTSIPEGRQTEAEKIGPLIQQYYNSIS